MLVSQWVEPLKHQFLTYLVTKSYLKSAPLYSIFRRRTSVFTYWEICKKSRHKHIVNWFYYTLRNLLHP